MPKTLDPADVLKGPSPLILTATLEPVAGDRFQPAGFPEIGHIIYKAPREGGTLEQVCIVDSAASMANHLESVCQRGTHDLDLVEELDGLPYVRCVTNHADGVAPIEDREVVVTSLTEGHRIASSYFLEGYPIEGDTKANDKFDQNLISKFGIVLPKGKKAHPPASQWWKVFKTIFELDPNSLVHGVLFPQWQIKIPRALTAHLEAFGAGRVDRSGVKFDKELGPKSDKRTQAIFAVDDATAESIRATFVLDVSLIRSFGRKQGDEQLGLSERRQELLVALALWKIQKLLESPFRFRSGCHLRSTTLKSDDQDVEIDVNIKQAIRDAAFRSEKTNDDKPKSPVVTDVFWPREELYREGAESGDKPEENDDDSQGEDDE